MGLVTRRLPAPSPADFDLPGRRVELSVTARRRRRWRNFLAIVFVGAIGVGLQKKTHLVVEGLVGVSMAAILALGPELVLLATPAVLLAGGGSIQGTMALGLPLLVVVYVGSGMFTGRYPTYYVPHGLIIVMILWLGVSYEYGKKLGPTALQSGGSFRNCVVAFAFAAAAISLRPNRRFVLMTVTVMGITAAIGVRLSAGAVAGSLADARVVALGYDPNGLGILMSLGVLAALGLAYSMRNPAWLAAGAVAASGLSLTKSRASITVLVVGIAVFVLFHRSRRVKVIVLVGLAALVLLVPQPKSLLVDSVLRDRASHLSSHSDWVRKQLVIEGFKAGIRNPVLGVGFGRFPILTLENPSLGVSGDPHNQYTEFFGSSGLPALAVFLGLLFLAVRAPVVDREDLGLKAVLGGIMMCLGTAPELYNLAGACMMLLVPATIISHDFASRFGTHELEEVAE